MAHASIQIDLPELPDAIRSRLVPYRAEKIEKGLRSQGYWHPGLFASLQDAIAVLEAEPRVDSITVDFEEDDEVYPVTIWARTAASLDEREELMQRVDALTDPILDQYPNLVLVAVL